MCRRFIASGMVAASLVACTSGGDKNAPPKPPPDPKPGQVVIIAGDHRIHRDPRDGEYALRTSAYGHGGLAVADDGSVYFRVAFQPDGRVAHIERDGRLTLKKLGNVPDQLAIRGDSFWLMGAQTGMSLVNVSLRTRKQRVFIGWKSALAENMLTVTTETGEVVSRDASRRLEKHWPGSKFELRGDGTPVIVSSKGDLFEVVGEGKLRRWKPKGYDSALKQVVGAGGLKPTDVAGDGRGGLTILGRRGLIRVPAVGRADSIRFPEAVAKLPPWTAMTALDDGSILLLGGRTATQDTLRPTLVRPTGRFELLSWGQAKDCSEFDGSLAVVGSAVPGGLARKPDGSFAMSDQICGQVYHFRLPPRLAGTIYP